VILSTLKIRYFLGTGGTSEYTAWDGNSAKEEGANPEWVRVFSNCTVDR